MRDTGTGISEEDLQKVFDLFYRGTNSRRENGMGIGLSVVKTIVDSHGWKIGVKSRLNEGTTFTITLG
jgi:signal transduction histidine kinase